MSSLLQELARFVIEIKFEDLPAPVVHEAKRTLLDSIGCALASITTDKGKMSIALARRLGGPAESSIIGAGGKVSCCNAALANGELINAMDYDALFSPIGGHISPNVIPAPMAIAESIDASGRDFVLATVLAHEITIRLSPALSPLAQFVQEEPGKMSIRWTPSYGFPRCNFGVVAGVGRLLKLDQNKMSHALGIAGHLSAVPTETKFSHSMPTAMTKYGAPGWQSTGGIIAALLAQMGYIGDVTVFDTEYGFWRFSGSEKWEPDRVMEGIGDKWHLLEQQYKPYPCCRLFHTALDCFIRIIDGNRLMPEDIERVKAFGHPFGELAACANNEIANHIDAQFSVAYAFAVAAHRVRVGVAWQDFDTMRNPKILGFMKKVSFQTHPLYNKERLKEPLMQMGRVEVVAKGKTFISLFKLL